jgi:hypothetical protein
MECDGMIVSLVLENKPKSIYQDAWTGKTVVRRPRNKWLLVAVRLLCLVKKFAGVADFSHKKRVCGKRPTQIARNRQICDMVLTSSPASAR